MYVKELDCVLPRVRRLMFSSGLEVDISGLVKERRQYYVVDKQRSS